MKHATIKIPFHSVIDIITNSSMEIFCDSSSSVQPCKDLVNEFLSQMGSDKTCDDIFNITLEHDEQQGNYDSHDTSEIIIEVKDEKYTKLAKLLYRYLYSGSYDAEYNG